MYHMCPFVSKALVVTHIAPKCGPKRLARGRGSAYNGQCPNRISTRARRQHLMAQKVTARSPVIQKRGIQASAADEKRNTRSSPRRNPLSCQLIASYWSHGTTVRNSAGKACRKRGCSVRSDEPTFACLLPRACRASRDVLSTESVIAGISPA